MTKRNSDGQVKKQLKLFTPGPLGISLSTKQAALRDLGSRDTEFIETTAFIRQKLLDIAGASSDVFACIPIQGTGTYANEAVLQSIVPRKNGRVLVIENGRYGERLTLACKYLDVDVYPLKFPETSSLNPDDVAKFLQKDSKWTNVVVIHCETSTGCLNPVEAIGRIVKTHAPDSVYHIDAMSSFGATPINLDSSPIDFMVSSANKCLEGMPGFSYVIGRKNILSKCKGKARSLCLDLVAQYENFEKCGQFRFTPPTNCMLAFKQALLELELEGGVKGRGARYKENQRRLINGMKKLGFKTFLKEEDCFYVITTFLIPDHPNWNFDTFYNRLKDQGQLIYPGKTTTIPSFRIGTVGHLFPKDIDYLLDVIQRVLQEMKINMRISSTSKCQE